MSEEKVQPPAEEIKKTEDNVQQNTSTEEKASISDKEMTDINKEIDGVEKGKLDAAKEEGKSEAINALEKQYEEIKAQNDIIRKNQEEEAAKATLQRKIDDETNFSNQVNKKRIVPESTNPVQPQVVTTKPAPDIPAWQVGNQLAGKAATLTKEDILKRN